MTLTDIINQYPPIQQATKPGHFITEITICGPDQQRLNLEFNNGSASQISQKKYDKIRTARGAKQVHHSWENGVIIDIIKI